MWARTLLFVLGCVCLADRAFAENFPKMLISWVCKSRLRLLMLPICWKLTDQTTALNNVPTVTPTTTFTATTSPTPLFTATTTSADLSADTTTPTILSTTTTTPTALTSTKTTTSTPTKAKPTKTTITTKTSTSHLLLLSSVVSLTVGMSIVPTTIGDNFDECQKSLGVSSNPCDLCKCLNDNGVWTKVCVPTECIPPPCQNYVRVPGQCCPVCPEGSNCLVGGSYIAPGEYALTEDGMFCMCEVSEGEPARYSCQPMTTPLPPPPTTPRCLEEEPDYGNCGSCECAYIDGRWGWSCLHTTCPDAPCDDPVNLPGHCCSTCPNGPTCLIDGITIPAGEDRLMPDGRSCYCNLPQTYSEFERVDRNSVYCVMKTTTPDNVTLPNNCEAKPKPYDGPCAFCTCAAVDNGQMDWVCAMASCPFPRCANPTYNKDQCCSSCPDGPNCQTYNGQIIKYEELLETEQGELCFCQEGMPTAICYPPKTTTPVDGCDAKPKPDESHCAYCYCAEVGNGQRDWVCAYPPCAYPLCANPVYEKDQCCPSCPNGQNCETYNGQIINYGETVETELGEVCFCQDGMPTAICTPPKTTTPVDGCDPQNKPPQDPCSYCFCDESLNQRRWVCYSAFCFPAPCVNSVRIPGQCCETCPNGPNCQYGDVVIPFNTTVHVSDTLECQCSQEMEWMRPEAICTFISTTPETTTTTTTTKPPRKTTTPKPPPKTTTRKTTTPKPPPKTTTRKTTTPKPPPKTTTRKTTTPKPPPKTTTRKTLNPKQKAL